MSTKHGNPQDDVKTELSNCLAKQREAYHRDPNPDLEQRRQDLHALKKMLSEHRNEISDAICKDYGNRSKHETMLAEIIMVLDGINFEPRICIGHSVKFTHEG